MSDRAEDAEVGFAFGVEAQSEGVQEWVAAFGDECGHEEGLAEVGVTPARESGGAFAVA